jgi:lipopolysaccharide/colanic/teichoic acid biosynthesis glycosyltransferase
MLKRGFDIVMSGTALVILAPLMLVLAILVRLDSSGPSLFRQTRVGRSFREFQVLKFRTMKPGGGGAEVTCGLDARITRCGALLRALKLDELPQLWNVFRGDMSLVGPRPEVPSFVERFRRDYEEILTVRPGITDPASIRYRSEARILGAAANPVDYYTQVILPDKIQISRVYLRSASFGRDVSLICQTIAALFQK